MLESESLDGSLLGTEETKSEENAVGRTFVRIWSRGREEGSWDVQVAREELGTVGHLGHLPVLGRVLDPGDADGVDTHNLAVAVRDELLGADAVLARVLAEEGSDLGVTVVDTEDLGPLGPLRRRIESVAGRG